MRTILSKQQFFSLAVSVLLSVFMVAVVAYGATMTISNTGLGSGTSTPGAALGVQGAAIIDGFTWTSSIVATSTSMHSGIGTTSPGLEFSVEGNVLVDGFTWTSVLVATSTDRASGVGTTSPGADFSVGGLGLFEGGVIASYLEATSTVTSSFGGALGIATSSPWGFNSVEVVAGTVDDETPIFVVGDSGSSTPAMQINASSSVGFFAPSPRTPFNVHNNIGTSTVYISTGISYVDNNHGGEIILTDADGGGCTAISVLDGTLKADTVTCPGEGN